MNLANTKSLSRFTLLQVGESGHGKTTRALSAAQFGPIKVLDIDDKLIALKSRLSPEIVALVDVDFPKSYDAIFKAVDSCDPTKFATLVVDTWSRAHELTIEKHKSLQPPNTPLTLQAWGAIKQENRKLLSKILSFPGNVIINTHVGKDKDSQDKQVLTVGTTGSFGAEMPQFFGETHYLYFSGGKFKVRGNRSDQIVANTTRPDSMLVEGLFKVFGLEIFADIAYQAGPK